METKRIVQKCSVGLEYDAKKECWFLKSIFLPESAPIIEGFAKEVIEYRDYKNVEGCRYVGSIIQFDQPLYAVCYLSRKGKEGKTEGPYTKGEAEKLKEESEFGANIHPWR